MSANPTAANAGSSESGSPEQLAIDTIRTLSMDAVLKAHSGHVGAPLGLAPVAYTLWTEFMRYDPGQPDWPNRDRFVLSVGHGSMLLYSVLHLAGVEEIDAHGKKTGKPAVSLDDVKAFRQLSSKTPGHPEYRMTTGVETTTGPLGQGCGNSVGMAIAERWLAARYNKPEAKVFDHDVIVLCGDGDMMEGVSSEAASLAGHLKLSNLLWIYDNNKVSIEGFTSLAFSEDVAKRFRGYGWKTLHVSDANDRSAIRRAMEEFRATDDRPTLVVVDSVIGYGLAKQQGTAAAHGEAFDAEDVKGAKRSYGWPEDKDFYVPDGVAADFRGRVETRGKAAREAWEADFARYRQAHPELAAEIDAMREGRLPDGWDASIPSFEPDAKGIASRDASGKVLNAIAERVPFLVGGSADLAPSNKSKLGFEGAGSFSADDYAGRNLHFGIREHGMGAVVNGMALSYVRPYGATFLVFSDYMRAPVRLSAIMEIPAVWVFTHDSIGVGEDGPTHQPVEHLASLRAIPGLNTIRPCDANETAEAWRVAMEQTHEPTALVLSRQPLPTLDRSKFAPASNLRRGAYILAEAEGGKPDVILLATGSEVSLCVAARETLAGEGIKARVVSMPSWHLFERQDESYRDEVLPPDVMARVAVEQGGSLGWDQYAGSKGAKIVMKTFGASAPIAKLQEKFGFTVDNVVKLAREQVAAGR
ncbi:transketolase [Aureimonas phyllosphaerae]|uniref:Transketolase n=1 Tax=Aureimonas phyllosphaerae TaxID=1166078 RepID=A0A7W6FV90_9HYPH|nr:transketolase [Aureimonas phyllosphaerae]MBB3936901.1 transketolase [Aureimonas phyllosphaerae]MBB3960984.1 transketolase [Aureimonas phyllosphaerae]SFF27213.1 transketolase [Aureimonas phyllosphaerae]